MEMTNKEILVLASLLDAKLDKIYNWIANKQIQKIKDGEIITIRLNEKQVKDFEKSEVYQILTNLEIKFSEMASLIKESSTEKEFENNLKKYL